MVEFQHFIKKLVCFLTSFKSAFVLEVKTSCADKDVSDFLSDFVVIVHQAEWLNGWAYNYFNIGVLRLEVVECMRDRSR